MPLTHITVDVHHADMARARAAAEGLLAFLGDRPGAWAASISTPLDASHWLVEVKGEHRGRPLSRSIVFDDPERQTPSAIVDRFRLLLAAYPT